VNFELERGEIHALVGENGAGKSTLMKILAGAIARDGGRIVLDGEDVGLASPGEAQQRGIGVIYQDFKLVPELSAAENILLGHEPTETVFHFVQRGRLRSRAHRLLQQLGESIDVRAPVKALTVAERQMVEIAKALSRNVRLLVMDEPTAPLTDRETANLFRVVRSLKADGVSIIYISHRLEEIFEIADRITVLRDGRVVVTCPASEATPSKLIRWMVGREMDEEYPRLARRRSDELLRVEHLTNRRLQDVSLTLYRGEILGIAGLVGAGRSDLARAIFGADPIQSGNMFLEGAPLRPRSPYEAIKAGIGLLTEDRNQQGLFLLRSVRENITVSDLRPVRGRFLLDRNKERGIASQFVERLRVKPGGTEMEVNALSGGNRQKVVLARWLHTRSRVLIFDEPTVGIDVGVKYEIHVLMNELARDGIGVIMISSDLPELLGVCDRVVVLCSGRVSGVLSRDEATKERVMSLATAFS
jgi:ribose transport system ATP-binding protein